MFEVVRGNFPSPAHYNGPGQPLFNATFTSSPGAVEHFAIEMLYGVEQGETTPVVPKRSQNALAA